MSLNTNLNKELGKVKNVHKVLVFTQVTKQPTKEITKKINIFSKSKLIGRNLIIKQGNNPKPSANTKKNFIRGGNGLAVPIVLEETVGHFHSNASVLIKIFGNV